MSCPPSSCLGTVIRYSKFCIKCFVFCMQHFLLTMRGPVSMLE
ncbi:hypothetical protein SAMCFNEI73_pC0521 (plasmid) [Sinorhizobium americanum]|uniref:Uncharacterized protein n=1 Tax=Sinorhizobium americanum TaxID=194963 RepID=A0A1L3LW03_9HYPH|nr:hypothetical protein SAMCCGM7_pC1752 [Sinorhizobium americanum CCGM7]APG94242.1 hypothetical protein SAMCFNEI73_pC0521 [Sinorhizobium americanum]